MPPVMPVKAIKNILKKEIESHKEHLFTQMSMGWFPDVQKEMIRIAFYTLTEKLDICQSYEDIQELLDFAGYRVSLDEWVNSL